MNDLSKPVHHDVPDAFSRSMSIAVAIVFAAILALMASPASAQTTEPGAEIYEQSCARCHQDDGLGLQGRYPPIAGNPDAADHDYVAIVVTNGLEGKEIMGVAYSSEMPSFANRLSPEEIQEVASYTAQLSTTGASSAPSSTIPTEEGSVSVGEDLFVGSMLLSEGGTACIACHEAGEYDRLGGPGMAISLNGIVGVYGKSGFIASITDPVVDEMIAVFGDHPISDQEASHIAAFLETTNEDTSGGSSFDILAVVGIGGFLLLILITARVIRGPQDVYVKKLRSTR